MRRLSKLTLAGLTVVAGLLVAGCQSNPAPAAAQGSSDANLAARCDKCQVTWVKERTTGGKGSPIVGYRDTKKMECPECRDAVATLLTTGKFEHSCKACGGNIKACEAH